MRDKVTSAGTKSKDFKRYENHVQRFIAKISKTVNKLHDEDHIDEIALEKINKLIDDF